MSKVINMPPASNEKPEKYEPKYQDKTTFKLLINFFLEVKTKAEDIVVKDLPGKEGKLADCLMESADKYCDFIEQNFKKD